MVFDFESTFTSLPTPKHLTSSWEAKHIPSNVPDFQTVRNKILVGPATPQASSDDPRMHEGILILVEFCIARILGQNNAESI